MSVRVHKGEGELPDDAIKLKELLLLREAIDVAIEEGMSRRDNLAEVLRRMLPSVCERVGARGAFVESYGEDLELHSFQHPEGLVVPARDEVRARTRDDRRERIAADEGDGVVFAQPLDVAGTWFGSAGLVFDRTSPTAKDEPHALALLNGLCEVLDNFLYSIRAARERHNVMMELGAALRHRVLGEGLAQAMTVLHRATPTGRALLVFVAEENASSMLHVQVYEGGQCVLDTMGGVDKGIDLDAIRREGAAYLRDGDRKLLARFGLEGAQEEVLINGVTKSVVVGKVVVTSRQGTFNTYDREILGGFAGFIRQRVVDFNKEWRRLAASFRPDDVGRLLMSDDYEQRFLTPREAEVAILYVDIAGFTKLSEQTLKTPAAVAELVEVWSRDAVDLVWAHGGVFDKMIGDCILALFGPPFYEEPPGGRLASAIRCAKAIREMTQRLPERPGFDALRGPGVGVSTGINLAPLFVGSFGPNGNFTGFSSGMNNTARLQGCAKRDQILVMDEAIPSLPAGGEFTFGEVATAAVKNVAAPLRFREVL
ncbi:MAG: adenylate/guanylate cyclase domain-containing protein [Polyangiaceae bacterium]